MQALDKIVKDHIDLSFIPKFYIVAGLYDLEYVREKHPKNYVWVRLASKVSDCTSEDATWKNK